MNTIQNLRAIDLGVVIIANLINLLLVLLFLGRISGRAEIARFAGIGTLILGIPLLVLIVINLNLKREWWTFVLPLLMVGFLLLELVLDYLLKIEFRSTWLVGPYLLVFYAASMVMVGYAFLTKPSYGVVTLITYFAQVALGVLSRVKTGL